MSTLSVELAPRVSDALQQRANAGGLGLSEYVGELLTEIVGEGDNAMMVRKLKGRKPRASVSTNMILELVQAGRK